MLEEVFVTLISSYSNDQEYCSLLWNKIVMKHGKANRYYHNLTHLENVYRSLLFVKKNIEDWDVILFVLFYHDYIYNALKQDNEELSAQKAEAILSSLSIAPARIEQCKEMIIATKKHQISENTDINHFTDADLSILGAEWSTYEEYFKNVRKEYKYYPDIVYNKGRIKVLQHFKDMPRIFKSDYFYSKLEIQAKKNIQQEINRLSN